MVPPDDSGLPAVFTELRGRLRTPDDPELFVPPPRFIDKHFTNYEIDHEMPGQADAVAEVRAFVERGPRRFWQWHRRKEKAGLYLDGDFGVGKTHLLAAAWHAGSGVRRYLSFSEAISLVVLHGPQRATDLLACDLLCLDEFELDDPSNTRLADLLIDGLVDRGTRLLVTSNTVPGELGEGRLFVDQFRAQLNRVADTFADVHVPGHDYRQRLRQAVDDPTSRWSSTSTPLPGSVAITALDLDGFLREIPVVSLRQVAKALPSLHIDGMHPYPDQLSALRLVHLVDRLYDWRVQLTVRAACAIEDIFAPDYRELGFKKKYRRCQSRLTELCAEPVTGRVG